MSRDQEIKLQELYDDIKDDPDFDSLRRSNINFVPGRGPMNPDLMLIGEAPGKMENAKGIPFVGGAGRYLNNFLSEAGINRQRVFVTNVIKYWPLDFGSTLFGKTRTPSTAEINAARDYLLNEIDIVNPKVVGLCGYFPLTTIFPGKKSIYSVHGKLLDDKYVPLYHPAVASYHPPKIPLLREGYMKLGDILKDCTPLAS